MIIIMKTISSSSPDLLSISFVMSLMVSVLDNNSHDKESNVSQ